MLLPSYRRLRESALLFVDRYQDSPGNIEGRTAFSASTPVNCRA